MTNEEKENLAEGISCVSIMVIMIMVIVVACSGLIRVGEHINQEMQKSAQEAKDKRTTIEGVVVKVESYIVPEPKEEPPKEGRTVIKFGPAHVPERTKVTFEDGRNKEFNGIMAKPLELGKYYVITYNGYNSIVDALIPAPKKD